MKRLLSLVFVGALAFTATACGGSDDSSSDSDTTETTTKVYERGSDEAVAAAEDVIKNGFPAEVTDKYGAATDVTCPEEIGAEGGEYDCDVEFEDGTTGVATVSTTDGEIVLKNLSLDVEEDTTDSGE